MATIRASAMLISGSPSCSYCRSTVKAAINMPKVGTRPLSLPNLSKRSVLLEDLNMRSDCRIPTISAPQSKTVSSCDPTVIAKLYAILEAVADRVEMHKNIGEQRDSWNHLLLNSINLMTLTAATMCGLAATNPAFKASSAILYVAATGLSGIMNHIQPSQLAEEQRNAARLFKQLQTQIQTTLSIGNPTVDDVNEAMEKVLALDKAYPLPLLGVMLEKFPSKVEPAVWWPKQKTRPKGGNTKNKVNGWNEELDGEMREILGVIKRKDKEEYLRLGEKALKLNKFLAISGPLLAGFGAVGAAFASKPLGMGIGVLCGILSCILNTIEHGGQVGMVFEMYRSNAGFFKLMEESIECNVRERRENGEVVQMKVGLQLGRSVSELEDVAKSQEFASKLF